jgi:hypothetical protein
MLKLLADCGARLIQEVVSVCLKGRNIELGIILVTQTSGRKSTWNPHLHLLATEGGLDKFNHWHKFYYFDYKILCKKWRYILLSSLKKLMTDNPQAIRVIDMVFQKTEEFGFITRAKKEKLRRTDIITYLIKYIASPAIALYRITGYDGEYVEYWYREHPTDRHVSIRVSAYEFIALLIQHIPPKALKLIRHYGLYARCKVKRIKDTIDKIFKLVKTVSHGFLSFFKVNLALTYQDRLRKSFNIDPFKCPHCGNQLILYEVWHPKYGIVYDIFRDERWVDYVVEEKRPENSRYIQQDNQLFLFEMQSSN